MKRIADMTVKILVICGLVLLCAACRSDAAGGSLSDMETVAYDHPQNGASLTLPADWQMLSETDEAVVFADADDTVSLTLTRELGGYSYYSADGLLEMAGKVADTVLEEPETLAAAEADKPKDAVVLTCAGQLAGAAEDAPNAICETVIVSPLAAVRYYLVAVAEVDYYAENADVLQDIYASFRLNKTEDEIYQALSLTGEE